MYVCLPTSMTAAFLHNYIYKAIFINDCRCVRARLTNACTILAGKGKVHLFCETLRPIAKASTTINRNCVSGRCAGPSPKSTVVVFHHGLYLSFYNHYLSFLTHFIIVSAPHQGASWQSSTTAFIYHFIIIYLSFYNHFIIVSVPHQGAWWRSSTTAA